MVTPNSKVQVFGEFSPAKPWQVLMTCKYDEKLSCFKANLVISEGQLFKFSIDDGKQYMVSESYPCKYDSNGNINNIFINLPNQPSDRSGYYVDGARNGYQSL